MSVRSNGLYRAEADDIANALGLRPEDVPWLIRANLLQITNRGQAVATLSSQDSSGIYFYGKVADGRHAKTNAYWLKVGMGLDMVRLNLGAIEAAKGVPFTERVHAEEDRPEVDTLFLMTDPGADYLAWEIVIAGNPDSCSTCRKQFEVGSDGVVRQGAAQLTVNLQGATALAAAGMADHHAVLTLNGTRIGEGSGAGEAAFRLTVDFDAALLRDGSNSLEVAGVRNPAVPASVFFVDSLDLTYRRLYRAVNDRLLLRGEDNPAVSVEGFSTPKVMVLDVTDSTRPRAIADPRVDRQGDLYCVTFRPEGPDRLYLAIGEKAVASAQPEPRRSTGLRSPSNGADYVIITSPPLRSAAEQLSSYRESRGLGTRVVDTTDIYDEFNHGIPGAEAIRSFLTYAHRNWSPAPRYALMAGDGTYEYDDADISAGNLLPVMMVSTPSGLYPSDNSLGDVVGDEGIPEIAVGRLPVTSAEELLGYLEKVRAYEAAGDLPRTVLFLADRPDGQADFPADSDSIAALVPQTNVVKKVHISQYGPAEARSMTASAIRSGVSLVNYVGHGSSDRLASQGLVTVDDAEGSLDAPVSPVVSAITCLPNLFYVPNHRTLGEALVARRGGGATAVWGPTGQPDNDEALKLNAAFVQSAFGERPRRLGDATLDALRTYATNGGSRWMLEIFELLGDPALELR